MKKLTLSLAVLLSGIAANSFASLPNTGSRNGVCVPNFCGGFTFGIAGLYWRPSTPELDYALTFQNTDLFNLTDGHHHSIDPDYDWGFRANIGYVFPCSGNDVTLAWTHYDQDEHDRIRNPGFLLPSLSPLFFTPGVVSSPVTLEFAGSPDTTPVFTATVVVPFPLVITPDDLALACAKTEFRNDAVDLEFGQSINVGCNLHIRWYGGLRWAQIEHDYDATYLSDDILDSDTFADPTLILTSGTSTAVVSVTIDFDFLTNLREIVNQKSDFEGVGPRFGVDASYHLGGGFGVVGGISTSLLIGEVDSTLFERFEQATTATVTTAAFANVGDPAITTLTVNGTPIADLPGTTFVTLADREISFKHPDETRVVPNIDARIGIDYSYAFCNPSRSKLTIEAGWMVSHYFNAIDRLSLVGGILPEARTRHTIDASFDGPYIGVQVNI